MSIPSQETKIICHAAIRCYGSLKAMSEAHDWHHIRSDHARVDTKTNRHFTNWTMLCVNGVERDYENIKEFINHHNYG